MSSFLRDSVSNGNPREQALIRRWWHTVHRATGRLVFDYHLEGRHADAIWFPDEPGTNPEASGKAAGSRFPLVGAEIVLCEAKLELNPEVIGQALVYRTFAIRAGARVRDTVVFSESGTEAMRRAAAELGLSLVVEPL